jgi:adenylosuccinate synthase
MTNLHVVVGAQYGSEAKGHVTAQIIKKHSVVGGAVANVRVAGPNAGHSVVAESGHSARRQSVPCSLASRA